MIALLVPSVAHTQSVDIDRVVPELEAEIQRMMIEGKVPSATIALVSGDRTVWTGAYGYSNLWARTPATPSTVYLIGSTFKAMSSLALLNVMQENGISLDEPVRNHLNAMEIRGEDSIHPVTYRHLFTHTSGLPRAFGGYPVWGDSVPPSMRDYLQRDLEVVSPPMDSVRYSNLAYTLIGYLVQNLTGDDYRKHIQATVFDPLEMSSTAFIPTPEMGERLAIPYALDSETGKHVPAVRVKAEVWPAGIVYGTVQDQANWMIANLNGGVFKGRRVIDEATLREMHTLQFEEFAEPSDDFGGAETGHGLTWRVTERRGERLFAHSGSVSGYTALLVGNLDRRLGFVILTNGHRAHPHLYRLADQALEIMKRNSLGAVQ